VDNIGTFLTFSPVTDTYSCATGATGVPASTRPDNVLIDFSTKGVNPCTINANARIAVTILCTTPAHC
jgi:hypothetical protein